MFPFNKIPVPQLHPDLLPFVKGDELWHPLLVVEGGLYPYLYNRVNQAYFYKLKLQQQEQPAPVNEWQRFYPELELFERQKRLMLECLDRDDPAHFRLLGQVWTDPEILACTSSFLECFLQLDPVLMAEQYSPQLLPQNVRYLMTESEQQTLAKLPEQMTIYRGHHERLLRGISWTLNPEVALLWAAGWCGSLKDRRFSQGMVDKSAVSAYINRWHEEEIIVPTSVVKNIVTVDLGQLNLPEIWFI
jgi:hypothetical protein